MANTINWGKAAENNTNGYGKLATNTINAGDIYEDSWAGETALIGVSAAFSYAKSSYHQDEADPTPTITGTTGGTFSATPSGLSINTSTGTIDLDASTIQSYTITYTVSGVSSNFSLGVTASPFIDNTYSMQFDGVNDYVDSSMYFGVPPIDRYNKDTFSVSLWIKVDASQLVNWQYYTPVSATTNGTNVGLVTRKFANSTGYVLSSDGDTGTTQLDDGNWHHLVGVFNSSNDNWKIYVNGNSTPEINQTIQSWQYFNKNVKIGQAGSQTNYFPGKIDEVAVWFTALSEDAIAEIYNATANNTGKALDLSTDYNNYTSSSNLQYWNRLGD